MRLPRRTRSAAALLVAMTLLAGACGDDDSSDAEVDETEQADGGEGTTTEAAFPAEVEHEFGTTTVEEAPERVVTVGYNDQDFVLAFGVEPVAVRWWYGSETDATQPWTDAVVGDTEPKVLVMPELNVEAVAAERPDLIIGVYSGMTEEEYEQLSQIAPTVPQPKGFKEYGVPWQDVTRQVGTALGQPDRAEELIDDLEDRFEAAREAHPEFAGKSVAVASAGTPNELSFFASSDPRSRLFTELGFVVPEELDEIAGEEFYGAVSQERAALLDRDLLVWDQLAFVDGGRATVEADPILSGLAAMKEGRAIFLEGETEAAFGWNTILSIPVALDAIVALVAEALS